MTYVFPHLRAHAAGVTCVAPCPHDPHAVATGSYDDSLRLWDVRQMSRPLETAAANCGGGVWRCRWHPSRRRLACAAMGGGAAVVEWTGSKGKATAAATAAAAAAAAGARARAGDHEDEEEEDEEEEEEQDVFRGGELKVLRIYEGHGSIAYGADWGWRCGGGGGCGEGASEDEEGVEDVVVSCSFYDKGLHVWSPRVA